MEGSHFFCSDISCYFWDSGMIFKSNDSYTFVESYNVILSVHLNSLLTWNSREICEWMTYFIKTK